MYEGDGNAGGGNGGEAVDGAERLKVLAAGLSKGGKRGKKRDREERDKERIQLKNIKDNDFWIFLIF